MRFADSELGKMMHTRKDIKREYRFRLPLDESTSLAGSIDALITPSAREGQPYLTSPNVGEERKEGLYTIIDYKITEHENTPPGLYESQLDFYALVIHELTGADSVKTVIAFLREGMTAERVITDFEAIRERVSHAAEICASGPYMPNNQHCGLCPFKKGCVNYADV